MEDMELMKEREEMCEMKGLVEDWNIKKRKGKGKGNRDSFIAGRALQLDNWNGQFRYSDAYHFFVDC